MRIAKLALLIASGLVLSVIPLRGIDAALPLAPPLAPPLTPLATPTILVDCANFADLNLDAAAQEKLDDLILCHRSLLSARDYYLQITKKDPQDDSSREKFRRVNVALANNERALRRQANELTAANDVRTKLIASLSTNTRVAGEVKAQDQSLPANDKPGREAQKKELSDAMSLADADLKRIEAVVAYSEKKLFVNSEDYEDYFFRLNTGYEFVAIDKLLSKGTPRVSLLINSKVLGAPVNDQTIGWGFYGIRFNVAATLNSSAEVTPALPTDANSLATKAGDTAGSSDSASSDVTKSLEIELQTVVPLVRTRLFSPNNLWSYYSLITTLGGLKTDSQPQTVKRYYGGIRFSINPELYSEVLVGRTETLHSLRLEYRGQLPVYTLASGDRIFLGAIINLGLDHQEKNEKDAFRIYVSWNTDLKKLFSGS